MNTRLLLLAVALGAFALGCNSEPPVSQSSADTAVQGKQAELKKKLDGMSPEERAKYLQEHPEEVQQLGAS